MDVKEIIKMLNEDRAYELQALSHYMMHHYLASGPESPPVADLMKDQSIDEMKHAEKLGERIVALGGDPVSKPVPIKGPVKGLEAQIKAALGEEIEAIGRYKGHIKALQEGSEDYTTRRMLEDILAEEEEHKQNLENLLK